MTVYEVGDIVKLKKKFTPIKTNAINNMRNSLLPKDKEKDEKADEIFKDTFDFVKETLGDRVDVVKATTKLKSHPVCISSGEGITFEMEKYFQTIQPDTDIKADRILELNVDHAAFAALEAAVSADPEKAKKYATLLYNQALLIAGLPLEDPSAYTDLVCELMK